MEEKTIAPCGMNCALCLAYQRSKNTCGGCRGEHEKIHPGCLRCIIKNCDSLKNCSSGYCYDCEKYPCKRLKDLDKRYKTKYGMSMIENLTMIKNKGILAFIISQEKKWKCKKCGALLCVHRNLCQKCNYEYRGKYCSKEKQP